MSGGEHKGPWVYMTANGGVLIREQEMSPEYGAVLLVPQTEVDTLQANYDDAFNHINEVKDALDLVGDVSESIGEGVRKLVAEIGPLKARLIQTEAARDDWRTSYIKSETALTELKSASPSLPAVDSPEALRYAADVMAAFTDGSNFGLLHASGLRDEADRVEREEAEKAKRDKVTDELLNLVSGARTVGVQIVVDELLDRFDITPKGGCA